MERCSGDPQDPGSGQRWGAESGRQEVGEGRQPVVEGWVEGGIQAGSWVRLGPLEGCVAFPCQQDPTRGPGAGAQVTRFWC